MAACEASSFSTALPAGAKTACSVEHGAGLVGAKFEAMGGDPIKPPRIPDLARPLQGLAIVIWAGLRRRGRREWIEDAWFDFLRQLAQPVGPLLEDARARSAAIADRRIAVAEGERHP